MENEFLKKVLFWTPRVLGVTIVLFWMLFTFLSHGFSVVMLIESIVWVSLLAAFLLAIKWPYVGGAVFIFLGVLDIVLTFGRFPLTVYLFTALPVLVTGGLFLLEEYMKKK